MKKIKIKKVVIKGTGIHAGLRIDADSKRGLSFFHNTIMIMIPSVLCCCHSDWLLQIW